MKKESIPSGQNEQTDFFDEINNSLCFKAMKELGSNRDKELIEKTAEKFGVAKDKLVTYLEDRKILEDKWRQEEAEQQRNRPSDYETYKNND